MSDVDLDQKLLAADRKAVQRKHLRRRLNDYSLNLHDYKYADHTPALSAAERDLVEKNKKKR